METWRKVWREGVAPLLSTKGLWTLLDGLTRDDPSLMQGATTTPPPLQCVLDWPCEAACLIGYAGWQGDELGSVGEVEEFFAKVCFEADQRLGEPGAIRYLLNWYDDTPRDEMRRVLSQEIRGEIANREGKTDGTVQPEPGVGAAVRQGTDPVRDG